MSNFTLSGKYIRSLEELLYNILPDYNIIVKDFISSYVDNIEDLLKNDDPIDVTKKFLDDLKKYSNKIIFTENKRSIKDKLREIFRLNNKKNYKEDIYRRILKTYEELLVENGIGCAIINNTLEFYKDKLSENEYFGKVINLRYYLNMNFHKPLISIIEYYSEISEMIKNEKYSYKDLSKIIDKIIERLMIVGVWYTIFDKEIDDFKKLYNEMKENIRNNKLNMEYLYKNIAEFLYIGIYEIPNNSLILSNKSDPIDSNIIYPKIYDMIIEIRDNIKEIIKNDKIDQKYMDTFKAFTEIVDNIEKYYNSIKS